jgi:hypothetical protein
LAITTREQLVTASQNATTHHYYRTGLTATNAGAYRMSTWYSSTGWPVAPVHGQNAPAPYANSTLNSSSTGAVPLGPVADGQNYYLTGLSVSANAGYSYMLMDRLTQGPSNTFNLGTTGTQTANLISGLPSRQTDFTSYNVYLESYYLNTSSTVASGIVTASYTNENGVAGRTGTFDLGVPIYGNNSGWTIGPMRLQAGDFGCQSVQAAAVASAGTANTFGQFVFAKPLAMLSTDPVSREVRLGYADVGLVNLGPDPCLYFQIQGTATAITVLNASITCVAG